MKKEKNQNYYIGIIGGDPLKHFKIVDDAINEEIDKNNIPMLFYIITNNACLPFGNTPQERLMHLDNYWGEQRGLPEYYVKSQDKLFKKADFIFFVVEKDDMDTKRAIMRFKMMENKHGRVILV